MEKFFIFHLNFQWNFLIFKYCGPSNYLPMIICYLKGRNLRGKNFLQNLILQIEAKILRVSQEFDFTNAWIFDQKIKLPN